MPRILGLALGMQVHLELLARPVDRRAVGRRCHGDLVPGCRQDGLGLAQCAVAPGQSRILQQPVQHGLLLVNVRLLLGHVLSQREGVDRGQRLTLGHMVADLDPD